jgi:hypothetical protein
MAESSSPNYHMPPPNSTTNILCIGMCREDGIGEEQAVKRCSLDEKLRTASRQTESLETRVSAGGK